MHSFHKWKLLSGKLGSWYFEVCGSSHFYTLWFSLVFSFLLTLDRLHFERGKTWRWKKIAKVANDMQRSVAWTKISDSWERTLRNRTEHNLSCIFVPLLHLEGRYAGRPPSLAHSRPSINTRWTPVTGQINSVSHVIEMYHMYLMAIMQNYQNQEEPTQCCPWHPQCNLQASWDLYALW